MHSSFTRVELNGERYNPWTQRVLFHMNRWTIGNMTRRTLRPGSWGLSSDIQGKTIQRQYSYGWFFWRSPRRFSGGTGRSSKMVPGYLARGPNPHRGGKPKTIPRKLVKNRPRDPIPSSHYYLRSLSWTSRTFYFPDSRDLLEVLRDFLGRERGGGP